MKNSAFLAAAALFTLFVAFPLHAQMDMAFGVSTLSNLSSSSAPQFVFGPQDLNGGAYLSFSGNAIFIKKQFGIGGEISWRASQAIYAGYQPYRPIFWDFNGVWVPKMGQRAAGEFQAGIGAESVRFYNNYYTCDFISCTNYDTRTHFLGHFSAGIRFYPVGNMFIRPEAHFYLVNNNEEFTSGKFVRYGVSIGYTFGGERY